MKPIFKIKPAGISANSHAPFWRGERAEDIIAKRVREYIKKKRKTRKKRAAK